MPISSDTLLKFIFPRSILFTLHVFTSSAGVAATTRNTPDSFAFKTYLFFPFIIHPPFSASRVALHFKSNKLLLLLLLLLLLSSPRQKQPTVSEGVNSTQTSKLRCQENCETWLEFSLCCFWTLIILLLHLFKLAYHRWVRNMYKTHIYAYMRVLICMYMFLHT